MRKLGKVGEAAFNEAYASLNAAQKEAVDTIEGSVMVIAGPGTGKTQILTLRIANILLNTDAQPENILALTFTESGVIAMRERLLSYIGPLAYRVAIHTFHSFAGEIIREFPEAFPEIVGARPASDIDVISILETILDDPMFALFRPSGNPSYYIGPIQNALSELKREYVTPELFAKLITEEEQTLSTIPKVHERGAYKGKVRGEYLDFEKKLKRYRTLHQVYVRYEALLREQGLFDFEDMIVRAVSTLESHEDVLRSLQEQYQYLHADEHQDVNGSQNKILELMASYHERPNIFVVGDEKQAIYRFQGASLENFLYFEDRFSNTKTIALTENYRSGQMILDAAHDLIAVEEGPLSELRVPLTSTRKIVADVSYRRFSHQGVEDTWLLDAIEKEIESGTHSGDIAVMLRTNREVAEVAQLLRTRGIAATASAEGDVLSHPITQTVRDLIEAIVAPESPVALFRILHAPYWGISTTDVATVCAAQRFDRPLQNIVASKETLTEIGVTDIDAVHHVHMVFEAARMQTTHRAPQEVLSFVVAESGLLTHLMERNPLDGGRVLRRLYDEIEEMVVREEVVTLSEAHTLFARLVQYGLSLNAPFIKTDQNAVQVMTAHKSKGLEFEVVFLPRLVDPAWGGNTKRDLFKLPKTKYLSKTTFDPLDDERRLLYVVMTRAKRALYLSSAEANTGGVARPDSRLIHEIDKTLLPTMPTAEEEQSFNPLRTLSATSSGVTIDTKFLTTTLAERGFSATSLNNYLKSPWDYFYRNVLRIPEVQPPHMLFGTAVHNTLERTTKQYTDTGTVPSESQLFSFLKSELEKLPLSNEEFVRRHEQGVKALTLYREHLSQNLSESTKEEFTLRVMLETGIKELSELPLTGKLDRLDCDKDGRVLRVVDYKTGKAKSRNVIEGKTKNTDGGYKRQLVFYALLLELYGDERYQTREGVLSFVEPDSKGKIHEHSFIVTDEEIAVLKADIIRVAKEIVSGEFLNQPCDPVASQYCDLVELLKGV